MKLLELIPGHRTLPTRLAIRRVALKNDIAIAEEPLPLGSGLITNFKSWLIEPKDTRSAAIRTERGDIDYVQFTGQECCIAFFRHLRRRIEGAGRTIFPTTRIRVSQPSFIDPAQRKAYQEAVRKAGKETGLAHIDFFDEPDAVFEYFRILRRDFAASSDRSLNVLVIDFGGGTCNISAVTTTKSGERFNRVLAPLAAEAPRAGGLEVDRRILMDSVKAVGLDDSVLRSDKPAWSIVSQWRESHLSYAEALKVHVSRTAEPSCVSVDLDEKLSQLLDQRKVVDVGLSHDGLRHLAERHWARSIRPVVEKVLTQMRDRLVVTARRKDIAEDSRSLVTHVLIAGGSSQLPGFEKSVREFFSPFTPEVRSVGPSFPYAVAAGMALSYLSQAKLLTDTRPAEAANLTFLPAFESSVYFHFRAFGGGNASFERLRLFSSLKSSWQLLVDGTSEITITLPRNIPATKSGRRIPRVVEYQVGYELEKDTKLSARRFSRHERTFDIPPDVIDSQIILRYRLDENKDGSLDLVADLLDHRQKKLFGTLREPVFIEAEPVVSHAPTRPTSETGGLSCGAADMICIDLGTTNTTVVDLAIPGEVSIDDFTDPFPESARHASVLVEIVPLLSAMSNPPSGADVGAQARVPARRTSAMLALVDSNSVRVNADETADATTEMSRRTVLMSAGSNRLSRSVESDATTTDSETESGGPPKTDPSAQATILDESDLVAVSGGSAPAESQQSDPQEREHIETGPRSTVKDDASAMQVSLLAPIAPKALSGRPFEGSEEAFIAYIAEYAEQSGLSFTKDIIETTYLSLKVRPLVILAGPSGIGKTSLARIMWETAGASIESQDAIRMAVEAHWTDARYLLGRKVHTEGYVETDLLRLLRRAASFPDRQYHALVDEMNLAHVEYYFAQFLSAMEADGRIVLPDLPAPNCHLTLPMVDGWLPLVRFYGTINVDETTQIISDKVIDRANVIELEAQLPGETVEPRAPRVKVEQQWHLTTEHLKKWGTLAEPLKVPEAIRDVWRVLANAHESIDWNAEQDKSGAAPRLAFGRRIFNDVAAFVAYAQRLGGRDRVKQATDWQVKQRILPKIRGDLRIRGTLDALHRCLSRHGLEQSSARLQRMVEQLNHDQFVTFWD